MQFTKTKRPYILYMNKSKLIWAGESLKSLVPVEFAKGVLVDLEFPNVRNFDNQVLTMVEKNNLKPSEVVIVLSSELFFSQQFASQAEEEMKSYLSIVPFDNVISKRFQNATGQQLVAISQDLVNPLIEVFKHHGFEVIAILPDFSLGESLKTDEQFSIEIVNTIIHSLVTLFPFSFYTPPKPQETMTSIRDSEGNIFNPRLILMIVFFVVLIGVLIAVLFTNGYLGQKKTVVPAITDEIETVIPTVTPLEMILEATSSSINQASNSAQNNFEIQNLLAFEILNGPDLPEEAEEIKNALLELGFKNIKTANTASASQKTVILHTSEITPFTLEVIVKKLEELGMEVSTQETLELSDVNIRIIIGKKSG